MKISDFIQEVLIDPFIEIQLNEENHYPLFGLICQTIEFLGACLDSESLGASLFFEHNQCVNGNRPAL